MKPKARGNGQGTAYKRGSTWTAQVVIGWKMGKDNQPIPIKRTKGGFKTKREALAYCPELLKAPTVRKIAPRLSHYAELYFAGECNKLSRCKRGAYIIAWKRLKPLHDYPMDQLTVALLRQTVSEAASTHYTARDCKVLLSHLFKLAGADGWVSKDLPSYIILPDLHEKERCPFLPEEQAALWRLYEAGNKDAAIPLLMIYTGMMPGEVMRMTPAMIHMEDHQIIGAGLKTKVRQESPIWLPDAVIPILDAALADPGHPLWLKSEKPLYLHYYAALEAAGTRRLEPYCCRHTTATALTITENIAPQTVQRIMRWANSRMLDRYAHPDEEAILSAVNTIGRTTDLLPTEAAAAVEKP